MYLCIDLLTMETCSADAWCVVGTRQGPEGKVEVIFVDFLSGLLSEMKVPEKHECL